MRIAVLLVLVLFLSSAASALPRESSTAAQEPTTIVVTNASDNVDDEETVCPDDELCTLRRAVELANGLDEQTPVTITFDPDVFPAGEEVVIPLAAVLPSLTAPGATIDATGQQVTLDGTDIGQNPTPGLRLSGEGQRLTGLGLRNFFGPCIQVTTENIVLGGDPSTGEGLVLGNCAIGVDIRSAHAHLLGSTLGVWRDSEPAPMPIGVRVLASEAVIGASDGDNPFGNHIANATTGILVGGGVEPVANTRIAANEFGGAGDIPGPVVDGVVIEVPAVGSDVSENVFWSIARNAISVGPSKAGVDATGHHFSFNSMTPGGIGGLGIDLGNDAVRNSSDAGDADTGPNGRLNPPRITRALPTRVSGTVEASCAGCVVELFVASHRPGGSQDYGATAFAAVVAGPAGLFSFASPPIEPGDWVVATVTDADSNTSEFSAPAVTGMGAAQCSGTVLETGWTHAGYFGTNATTLGETFPAAGVDAGKVSAIYHLLDGTSTFERWIAGETATNTLVALEPGEAYFFLASGPLTLPGGFTLTTAFPVALQSGWNDVVYIGFPGDVRDAFGSAGDALGAVHRFDHSWRMLMDSDVPEWAWQSPQVASCTAYQLHMSAAGILTPLQP